MEVRLQKAIAESGLCSRRKAEDLIKNGHVRVNGETAKIGMNVNPEKDAILVMGKPIRAEQKVYLMLNKPRDFITTASDPYGRRHVLQLINEPVRVFPVGRLDRDTTGFVILTNDGEFANRIMHPRYEVRKTYEAILDKKVEDKDIARLNEGLTIDRVRVQATAHKLSPKMVRITVHTGMNKEVKKIFHRLGYWVDALKRTEIQGVRCTIKEGRYRHLTPQEIQQLLGERTPKSRK